MATIDERIDKNGKITYRVQIRLKGASIQRATFERKTDAKIWAQQTEAAIREGRHFKTNEAKKHTVEEMIDRYMRDILPTKKKSEKRQGAQLVWWKQQIGSILLSNLSPGIIAEQRDKLLRGMTKRGRLRTPATTVRYLAAFSHVLSIATREWQWIDDSPMRKVTKPRESKGRVRFLSEDERKRLLEACKESSNKFLYIAVVVSLATGMRQSELMNLLWSDVDLQRGRIILEETKNGETGQVFVSGLALKLLQDLSHKRSIATNLLFPGKIPNKRMDLRAAWERALKKANIHNFLWHDMRHSFASELAMNGASLVDIKNLLRHKQISVSTRYSHLSEDHSAKVVARMNEKIFEGHG